MTIQPSQNSDIQSMKLDTIKTDSTNYDGDDAHELKDLVKSVSKASPSFKPETGDDPGNNNNNDAPSPASSPPPRSKFRTIAVVIALFTSLWITAFSSSVIATAIPTICTSLDSASGYSWIGGAYILANGAATPIWAKLSDIWGRKPVLMGAASLFFAASVWCALSSSMRILITGRAVQGLASGGVAQLVIITISDLFSQRDRALYFGLLQITWVMASGTGPVIGGVFSQTIGWHWCFWIDLPVAGIAVLLLFFFLDVHNPRTKVIDGLKAIDWLGSITMLAFVVMVLLGLDLGGTTYPWSSPRIIALLVCGCLMAFAFVLIEHRYAKYPLIPLQLFKHKTTNACLIISFVFDFVYIGGTYYIPLYMQLVRQVSPLQSGLLILPLLIASASVAIAVGFLIHRTGRYIELIRAGQCIMTLGFGLFIHFSATTPLPAVLAILAVAGIGAGFLFQPPLIALQAAVTPESQSSGTSALVFTRNLAMGLSVVLGGAVFQNSIVSYATTLRSAGIAESVIDALTSGGAAVNIGLIRGVTDEVQKTVLLDVLARCMRNMWIMYTCVGACGLGASSVLSHKGLSEEHVEVKTGLKRE